MLFRSKGENWSLTAGYRRSIGHTVVKFDPSDATGVSACFNPLEEIRLETIHAIPDAQNLVGMILDPQGKGLADYWNKAAFAFLGGTLLHCMVMVRHKEQHTATLLTSPARWPTPIGEFGSCSRKCWTPIMTASRAKYLTPRACNEICVNLH